VWYGRTSILGITSRFEAAVLYIRLADQVRLFDRYDLPIPERMVSDLRELAAYLDHHASRPSPQQTTRRTLAIRSRLSALRAIREQKAAQRRE